MEHYLNANTNATIRGDHTLRVAWRHGFHANGGERGAKYHATIYDLMIKEYVLSILDSMNGNCGPNQLVAILAGYWTILAFQTAMRS